MWLYSWIAISFKWFLKKQRSNYFIHTIYKLTFRIMYFIDGDIFEDFLPYVFPPFRTPFIVSSRYFQNTNTKFSSSNLNSKKQSNWLNSLLFRSVTPWDALNYISSKTLCFNLCYWNLPLDFVPLRKDWALVKAGT